MLGRPVAQQRFGVYAAEVKEEPRLLEDAETLDAALAWVQTYHRDVRRMFMPRLRKGVPCYGEIFDWEQGSTVMYWRIG
jgi:hypothetical protein